MSVQNLIFGRWMTNVIKVDTLMIVASRARTAFMTEWCVGSLMITCQWCRQQVRHHQILIIVTFELVLAISLIIKWLGLAAKTCIFESKHEQSTSPMIYCLVMSVEGASLSLIIVLHHLVLYKLVQPTANTMQVYVCSCSFDCLTLTVVFWIRALNWDDKVLSRWWSGCILLRLDWNSSQFSITEAITSSNLNLRETVMSIAWSTNKFPW